MYRFRKIEHLLGTHKELENQEIYFAPPGDLNDPMEGYKDIFWKGDLIVWKNFIINYVRSVEYTFMVIVLNGFENPLTNEDILVSPNTDAYIKLPKKQFFKEIIDKVFEHDFIAKLPQSLVNRKSTIRRNELISYLELVHPYILSIVSDVYYEKGLLPNRVFSRADGELSEIIERAGNLVELTDRLEEENLQIENPVELMFNISSWFRHQTNLIALFNSDGNPRTSNSVFLVSEYASRFVSQLEVVMYPDWYSASFLSENENSAVWGHYGDNHSGVCLKFKTSIDNGKTLINLKAEPNYMADRNGMRPHIFHKIEYHFKHAEIDFFRSLGRLNQLQLNHMWYKDENGNISECGEHMNTNAAEWRDHYWQQFTKCNTVKLEEWSYEKEFRLFLTGGLLDYSTPDKRKIKYDFNDLESITFGLKTKDEDKIKIMKIIETKCQAHKRKDFDFYQAYYDKATGKIKSYKLTLIKFE